MVYGHRSQPSVRKSRSALGSSSRKNLSSVLGRHSLHKAVYLFSGLLLRLISSLHCHLEIPSLFKPIPHISSRRLVPRLYISTIRNAQHSARPKIQTENHCTKLLYNKYSAFVNRVYNYFTINIHLTKHTSPKDKIHTLTRKNDSKFYTII